MLGAVIFDVDGVLCDSYAAHLRSWLEIARDNGAALSEACFAELFGRTNQDIVRRVWGPQTPCSEVRRISDLKEEHYRSIVRNSFPAMDGAAELIDELVAAGIRIAAGSSGPRQNVELALSGLGRRARFEAVVTDMDVTRGKPDPEVFLRAAEKLDVPAVACLVVEDAADGVRAARAAGMIAVGLVSAGRRSVDLERAGAALVVESLRDISVRLLRDLFRPQ